MLYAAGRLGTFCRYWLCGRTTATAPCYGVGPELSMGWVDPCHGLGQRIRGFTSMRYISRLFTYFFYLGRIGSRFCSFRWVDWVGSNMTKVLYFFMITQHTIAPQLSRSAQSELDFSSVGHIITDVRYRLLRSNQWNLFDGVCVLACSASDECGQSTF